MFRMGLKFPCNGLNRVSKVKKHGCTRVLLTARYYETRARCKLESSQGRLFKDGKLTSRVSCCKYSTESTKSGKKGGSGGIITIGAITLGTVGVLTYAKNNPEFRETLEQWIPGTDRTIRIVFQEDASYFEFIKKFFENIKDTITNLLMGDAEEQKKAPKAAFEPLVNKKEPAVNEPYAEIRLSQADTKEIEVVAEKPSPPKAKVPEELKPSSLLELENYCGETAKKAIAAYNTATCAIQDYNQDVIQVVENTDSSVGGHIWQRLKEATDKRKRSLAEAEKHANEALNSLRRMYHYIDDPQFQAPAVTKAAARRNVKKILDDVDEAKRKYDQESNATNLAERYWKQVKTAREHFNEELQVLFPNINVHDKKLSVNEEAFDLFVLHMYHKVNYLQKELEKLQTIREAKVKSALRAAGEDATQEKIDALICLEIDKEKRILREEFDKKMLEERKSFEEELRRQLKLQTEIHTDHLREALSAKEQEAQRKVNRALSEHAEAESTKYKLQLAPIIGRLRGLDAALKARLEEEKGACSAQLLWSACQALARAVKAAPPGVSADRAVRPLEPEIQAVSKVAPKQDALIDAAIKGIPEEAAKRGVFPENALRERFLKVEHMARRLALVPEEGASLPVYLLSYLQSFLLIKAASPIPKKELEDEPIDVESLNTYDILHRARYWLDRGDFKMALKYMNLLKGAPRCVARDWMNETRILLETQQAVDTLLAYAGAAGLIYLGAGDSLK